jgi:RNA polymerase sigma factor, sigma-70 family
MLTSITTLEDLTLSDALVDIQPGTQAVTERRLQEFNQILSRDLPRFRRIAMRWLRNREDAEDAVQEAMLSGFKHIAMFDGRSQMKTWLMAILINAVRMQIRRRPKSQMLPIDHGQDGQQDFAELIPDRDPTPEQAVAQNESRNLIQKLTVGLPPKHRAALKLRHERGLSIRETAAVLDVPEGTAKAYLARGRAKLIERFRHATQLKVGTMVFDLNITHNVHIDSINWNEEISAVSTGMLTMHSTNDMRVTA